MQRFMKSFCSQLESLGPGQVTKQLQDARAAQRGVAAWVESMPRQTVRFFSSWQSTSTVDTHFGSYCDSELHLVVLLGEEPEENGRGRVLDISAAFGKPLARRTESLGS
jgi:hypothetical protein